MKATKFKELVQTNIEESMLDKLGLLTPLIAGTSKEDYQQPSSCSDTEKGSTTSSESQVDNNSTTKAGQSKTGRDYFLEDSRVTTLVISPTPKRYPQIWID